ncbi:MAG: alpha/beta hydrolase [Proteobacteria bacterium]|nr:alpha/beta hydrolase [Pseudomonadota bacterium]
MKRLKLAATEIELLELGNGPPLLFLHGEDYFAQHRPFLDDLARTWRVIVPRLAGFGASPLPSSFMKVDDLAYLTLDLLDHLKHSKPLVVGASLGGWVALEVAVRGPDRIGRLALLGSVGVKLGGREDRDFADIFQIPESEVRKLVFADPKSVPDYAAMSDAELEGMARDRQTATHFAWRPYMHNPTLKTWLHRVSMPTLLVYGAQDGVVARGYPQKLAEALPSASLHVVANAGHYPQIEQPGEVVARLAAFASPKAG